MTTDDDSYAGVRYRLDSEIARIPVSPAPVTVVIRKGKLMRARRRVALVAGIVGLIVAAVAGPVLVRHLTMPVPATRSPKITVNALGPQAVHGVIAAGSINGKRWTIRMTTVTDSVGCASGPGAGWFPGGYCVEGVGKLRQWQNYGRAAISSFAPAFFGPVRSNVTLVTMRLSDGAVLDLRPVQAYGHQWIGIVLPPGLFVAEAIAYSGHTEIAHSVPFVGRLRPEPDIEFLSWLQPGDNGPARVTKVLRAGGETFVLHAGPWGNVLTGRGEAWSYSLSDHPSGALGGSAAIPRTVPMGFPAPAVYIELTLSDGRTRRVPLAHGAGVGFAVIQVRATPAILRWDVYDASGQRLTGGSGAPGGL